MGGEVNMVSGTFAAQAPGWAQKCIHCNSCNLLRCALAEALARLLAPIPHKILQCIKRFFACDPLSWWVRFRQYINPQPHRLQTHQQESSAEICAIDAPVDCRWVYFEPQLPQVLGQIAVSPVASCHFHLQQPTRLASPVFIRLSLGFWSARLCWDIHWPTNSLCRHILFQAKARATFQLRSILSHVNSGCLYGSPINMEATNA